MTTDSSILAWEFPQTEEPGGLQSMRSQRSNTIERPCNSRGSNPAADALRTLSPGIVCWVLCGNLKFRQC